jgi:hypothetical protein
MNQYSRSRVRDCGELSYGDEVDAWHNGRLHHHGRVIETYPSMGMFWILDARTGTRRLLDVEALDIVRQLPASQSAASNSEWSDV